MDDDFDFSGILFIGVAVGIVAAIIGSKDLGISGDFKQGFQSAGVTGGSIHRKKEMDDGKSGGDRGGKSRVRVRDGKGAGKNPLAGMDTQEMVNKIAADMGLRSTPTVKYACSYDGKSDFAGLADYERNTIAFCPSGNPTQANKEFTVAHEVSHFLQYQQNPDAIYRQVGVEKFADQNALDYFHRIGYKAPIEAKARSVNGGEYAPGREYAKELLRGKSKN